MNILVFRQAGEKVGQEKDRETDRQTDQYPHRGKNKPGASYSLWLRLRQQQHNDNDADEGCIVLYWVVQEFRLTEFQGGLVKLCVHFYSRRYIKSVRVLTKSTSLCCSEWCWNTASAYLVYPRLFVLYKWQVFSFVTAYIKQIMGAEHKAANYSKITGTSLGKNIYTAIRLRVNPNFRKWRLLAGTFGMLGGRKIKCLMIFFDYRTSGSDRHVMTSHYYTKIFCANSGL